MKLHLRLLLLLLALAGTSLGAEEPETLVRLDGTLRAGGYAFRVNSMELKHNEVHFHVVISGDGAPVPDGPLPKARLGFFTRDRDMTIGNARDVELKREGQSLTGDFTVHAGWLFRRGLCFVLTTFHPGNADAPPISYYLFPTDFWDPGRDLNADYDVMRVYQKTPNFYSEGADNDEIEIDLNGDGRPEKLLLNLSHAKWSHYSMFTYRDHQWRYIGDARLAGRPKVAKTAHHGWYDFTGEVSGSRGQLFRRSYRWDLTSHEYEEMEEKEIQPMERDPELDP